MKILVMIILAFGSAEYIALFSNSQFYENCSQVKDLARAREDWLDQELTTSKERGSKHIVVFQHIP